MKQLISSITILTLLFGLSNVAFAKSEEVIIFEPPDEDAPKDTAAGFKDEDDGDFVPPDRGNPKGPRGGTARVIR